MSRIVLKYHTNIKFYTQYTHPTLICRGTDGRTENIYSIFRDKLLLLGEHVYYLDKFNQNGVFIRRKQWLQYSIAVGTADRGLSPSWSLFSPRELIRALAWLWACTVVFSRYLSQIYACLCVVSMMHCCCTTNVSVWMRDSSLAAWMARSQYSCCSPLVVGRVSKLHSSRNLSSSSKSSGPRDSWWSISFRSSSLCDDINTPVVRSWTKMHW